MQLRRSVFGILVCVAMAAALPAFAQQQTGDWPTVDEQFKKDKVDPASALAALILANQDFSVLRLDEQNDNIGLPPWLRVWWRKGHPEAVYSASDPTGG